MHSRRHDGMDDDVCAGQAGEREISPGVVTGARGESKKGTSTVEGEKKEEEGRAQVEAEVPRTAVERWKHWFMSWMVYLDEQLAEVFGLNRSRYQWEIEEKRYLDWLAEQRCGLPTADPMVGVNGDVELSTREL